MSEEKKPVKDFLTSKPAAVVGFVVLLIVLIIVLKWVQPGETVIVSAVIAVSLVTLFLVTQQNQNNDAGDQEQMDERIKGIEQRVKKLENRTRRLVPLVIVALVGLIVIALILVIINRLPDSVWNDKWTSSICVIAATSATLIVGLAVMAFLLRYLSED